MRDFNERTDVVFERFTERARQVIVLAQEEARTIPHATIGTEHILLGLLREEEGMAARVLNELGLNTEGTRKLIVEARPPGDPSSEQQIPFDMRVKKLIDLSLREALSLGHNYIGTEHILLALVREGEGRAMAALAGVQVSGEQIRDDVLRRLTGVPRPKPKSKQHIVLDEQQAAHLFRLHVDRPLGGCQFEGGRMRWWLAQGLLLELMAGEWRLSVPPRRDRASAESETAA